MNKDDIKNIKPRERLRYKGQHAIVTAISEKKISLFLEERREHVTDMDLYQKKKGQYYPNATFLSR